MSASAGHHAGGTGHRPNLDRHPIWQRFVERSAHGDRMNIGAYMFVLHRLSGVVLTLYLFVHLFTLGSVLQSPDGYDRMMALLNNPVARGLELVLVWLVLYHTLNGMRLVLLHLVPGLDQRQLARGALFLSFLAVVLSIPFFFAVRF